MVIKAAVGKGKTRAVNYFETTKSNDDHRPPRPPQPPTTATTQIFSEPVLYQIGKKITAIFEALILVSFIHRYYCCSPLKFV